MSKRVVFAWGRFNPPTTGHKVVMDRVAEEAKKRKAEYLIFASKSNDPKRNPLPFKVKVKFLKQAFPEHARRINTTPSLKTVISVMKFLDKKYDEVSLVVGDDRVSEFQNLLTRYNGSDYNFDNIEIISAGQRDPDAEGIVGMSASKLRAAAASGDYESFKAGSPLKNPKELYNAIRRGMKINEDFRRSICEVVDVTDRSVSGKRFNALLRFGLVPTKDIAITKRAFKDLTAAAPNPELRKHILDVADKILEYVMADDILYRRTLLLLYDNFLMQEDHHLSLAKKSQKSNIPYNALLEVFLRGLACSPVVSDKTPHQYAFDRVNSFVSGGHAREKLDDDIWEGIEEDTRYQEWGTKELADKYLQATPGQPKSMDNILNKKIDEVAPRGNKAEKFIKGNKKKFKDRYGDDWESVLYATAWKLFGNKD